MDKINITEKKKKAFTHVQDFALFYDLYLRKFIIMED